MKMPMKIVSGSLNTIIDVSTSKQHMQKSLRMNLYMLLHSRNYTAVHLGTLSHFIVALIDTDALCNVWSARRLTACVCISAGNCSRRE